MPAPLVVHVGPAVATASELLDAPHAGARHLVDAPTARADVVVLHGAAGRRAPRLRHLPALVVRRPNAGERPSVADRRALRWTDLVAVRSATEVQAWQTAVGRPGRTVEVVAADSPTGWAPVLHRALAPAGPAAERSRGHELLVAPAEPTGTVERLTGSGPEIWAHLRRGRTPAQVAHDLRPGDDEAREAIEAFAAQLARHGVAVPA